MHHVHFSIRSSQSVLLNKDQRGVADRTSRIQLELVYPVKILKAYKISISADLNIRTPFHMYKDKGVVFNLALILL